MPTSVPSAPILTDSARLRCHLRQTRVFAAEAFATSLRWTEPPSAKGSKEPWWIVGLLLILTVVATLAIYSVITQLAVAPERSLAAAQKVVRQTTSR